MKSYQVPRGYDVIADREGGQERKCGFYTPRLERDGSTDETRDRRTNGSTDPQTDKLTNQLTERPTDEACQYHCVSTTKMNC